MVNTFSKTRQKQNKPHTRSRNIQTVYSVVIYILSNVHVLLDQLFQFVSSWTWLKTCRSERKRERHTQMEGWGEAADKLQSVCRTVVKVPTGFFSSGCFCRDLQVQVRHTHTHTPLTSAGPVQLTGWRWRWWRVHGLPESRRWSFYSCCTRHEQVHSHTSSALLKSV